MSTDLIIAGEDEYPILANGGRVAEIIRQNMGGEQVSPSDLCRIRVPAGGGTSWTIETVDGEQTAKALDGVIVHVALRRAYWPDSNPSGLPPACASSDCVTGVGNPGGSCDSCPMNVFGSALRQDGGTGRGKACKESKLLFILRPGQTLPDVVSIPPASLRPIRQYQLRLGVPYCTVVTRIELVKTKNKDGIAYAQAKPSKIGVLNESAVKGILAYAQNLQSVFERVELDATELYGEDDGGEV